MKRFTVRQVRVLGDMRYKLELFGAGRGTQRWVQGGDRDPAGGDKILGSYGGTCWYGVPKEIKRPRSFAEFARCFTEL